jgi:hypothetical protein
MTLVTAREPRGYNRAITINPTRQWFVYKPSVHWEISICFQTHINIYDSLDVSLVTRAISTPNDDISILMETFMVHCFFVLKFTYISLHAISSMNRLG